MKLRQGFVSNSSATSFVITNRTAERLRLVDFVQENIHLVKQFNQEYNWHHYTEEEALAAVGNYPEFLEPGENICTFGDEDCNVLGNIYDYILRDGGSSERFLWCFHEYLR
jgi:hypothetical protein